MLREALRGVQDLERLVTRAAQGLSGPRELVTLRRSLEALPQVREAAEAAASLAVRRRAAVVEGAPEVAQELGRALVEEPPAILREGGSAIRDGFDEALDRISEASRGSREWLAALESVSASGPGSRPQGRLQPRVRVLPGDLSRQSSGGAR